MRTYRILETWLVSPRGIIRLGPPRLTSRWSYRMKLAELRKHRLYTMMMAHAAGAAVDWKIEIRVWKPGKKTSTMEVL